MTIFDRPVSEFMSSPVETIHPDSSLDEAQRRLGQGTHSSLAVTDVDGRICGVISRTDVLRIGRLRASMGFERQLLKQPHHTVRMRMVPDVIKVTPSTTLRAAAAAMVEHYIHRVFVVENDRPIGVLSTRDLMRAVVETRVSEPLQRWMSSPVITVGVFDTVESATELLQQSRVRGLVVEDLGWPVGVYTQQEALAAAECAADTPVEEVMSCALLCLPVSLPLFRAAAFALDTRARRILAVSAREIHGILSGLDMARLAACGHTDLKKV